MSRTNKGSGGGRAWKESAGRDENAGVLSGTFEEKCRRRGIRVTAQRLAVYRALVDDKAHPTADALHAKLRRNMTWLSLATVYRVLESLEKEGFVRRVSTTDGVARFDANLASHQHLVCRICGCIADIEEKSFARLSPPQDDLSGFEAEALDIRIIGTCKKCRRTQPKGRRIWKTEP